MFRELLGAFLALMGLVLYGMLLLMVYVAPFAVVLIIGYLLLGRP